MAAFVKCWTNPSAKLPRYVRLSLSEETSIRPTRNLLGTVFSGCLFVDQKDGKLLSEVKPGQHFVIQVGSALVDGFTGMYQPTHRLYELCDSVGAPTLLESGEETSLNIFCRAKKGFVVADLDVVSRLYVVD